MRTHPWLVALALLAAPTAAAAQILPAQSTPRPVPIPAASAAVLPAAPAIMLRAREWFHRMQTGDIDRTQLTTAVSTEYTDALVKTVATMTGALGDPNGFTYIDKLDFASSSLYFLFTLDGADKISGLRLSPVSQ
jgi:hypothetical protein